ncbi:MAG TPA: exo-alpha-sialidase, partial [Dysgonamonadaceae bacterium]|nr:exo-alpha-sialidase [Dysgonamonadaceae bacterium]
AGAPYLIRTDGGYYVLSYQTTNNRTSNWELSTMEVVVSDKPSDFISPSQPFVVPLSKEAKWNSLCDLGNGEIAAVSSTNFKFDKIGIWMIKGEIEDNRK